MLRPLDRRAWPDRPRTARRSRDRRGRGPRGPLALAAIPRDRSRAERFDDLVLDAVEHLERRWRDELAEVELAVEEVPPGEPVDALDLDPVPLARVEDGGRTVRLIVHRWPIELRARDGLELAALVHDVVVEQVADLLGVEPETVDPHYGLDDD
jgi:predicted Zn-dependent protease with MMP-like domain